MRSPPDFVKFKSGGRIKGYGISRSCPGSAALAFDGKTVQAYSNADIPAYFPTLNR